MRLLVFIPLLFLFVRSQSVDKRDPVNVCLSEEEKRFYDLMMEYRAAKGLVKIPFSPKLTMVAQAHAKDLAENYTFDPEGQCNPHSWSKKGSWSSCCYTSDHKEAKCMWDKPKEIAGYEGAGYEIAYYSSRGATAEEGLKGWQKSTSHNPLMINEGIWAKAKWRAVGIGFYKEYGIVWFGETEDTSEILVCDSN
jgi:uncharacterized protein YkwD